MIINILFLKILIFFCFNCIYFLKKYFSFNYIFILFFKYYLY